MASFQARPEDILNDVFDPETPLTDHLYRHANLLHTHACQASYAIDKFVEDCTPSNSIYTTYTRAHAPITSIIETMATSRGIIASIVQLYNDPSIGNPQAATSTLKIKWAEDIPDDKDGYGPLTLKHSQEIVQSLKPTVHSIEQATIVLLEHARQHNITGVTVLAAKILVCLHELDHAFHELCQFA